MPSQAKIRNPHWYTIPVRVVLLTALLTLLSFAICLFLSIVGTVVVGVLHRASPDLRAAYRHFALPAAVVAGAVALVASTVIEVRYFRQSRALAGIQRMSQG